MPWIQSGIIISGLTAIFLTVRTEYGAGFPLFSVEWFSYYAQAVIDSFSHPHPIVIALPAGIYLWWRGIILGRSFFHFTDVYRSFLIGLSALILLIIVWGISAGAYSIQIMTSTVGIHVIGFFFFGLMAMALVNLHDIQQRMKAKDGLAKSFGRRWFLVIIGVTGSVVLIGIGIASIFSPQIINFIRQILDFVYDILIKIFVFLMIPILFVLEWLIYLGKLIINWLSGGKSPPPVETPEFLNPENLEEGTGNLSPEVILALKWVVLALILIAVIFILYKTVKRIRSSRSKDEIEEEQESLWSWGGFKSDLRLFFDMIFGRFRRKKKLISENIRSDYPVEAEDSVTRLSIREIYRHLLRQTAKTGVPREKDETPYEYAGRLVKIIPDGVEPLTELTKLYVDVRYGEYQIEEKKIDNANSLWRRLRIIFFK
jgi:cbb3-type cytochrome oxidase subunit 3